MAGGHPTYPSRRTSASEGGAGAEPNTVFLGIARNAFAFLLGLCVPTALPANWLLMADPQKSANKADELAPAEKDPFGGSALADAASKGALSRPGSGSGISDIVLRVGIRFGRPPETALFDAYRKTQDLAVKLGAQPKEYFPLESVLAGKSG